MKHLNISYLKTETQTRLILGLIGIITTIVELAILKEISLNQKLVFIIPIGYSAIFYIMYFLDCSNEALKFKKLLHKRTSHFIKTYRENEPQILQELIDQLVSEEKYEHAQIFKDYLDNKKTAK